LDCLCRMSTQIGVWVTLAPAGITSNTPVSRELEWGSLGRSLRMWTLHVHRDAMKWRRETLRMVRKKSCRSIGAVCVWSQLSVFVLSCILGMHVHRTSAEYLCRVRVLRSWDQNQGYSSRNMFMFNPECSRQLKVQQNNNYTSSNVLYVMEWVYSNLCNPQGECELMLHSNDMYMYWHHLCTGSCADADSVSHFSASGLSGFLTVSYKLPHT